MVDLDEKIAALEQEIEEYKAAWNAATTSETRNLLLQSIVSARAILDKLTDKQSSGGIENCRFLSHSASFCL